MVNNFYSNIGDNFGLPAGTRRFIKTSLLFKNEIVTAFKNAKIIN